MVLTIAGAPEAAIEIYHLFLLKYIIQLIFSSSLASSTSRYFLVGVIQTIIPIRPSLMGQVSYDWLISVITKHRSTKIWLWILTGSLCIHYIAATLLPHEIGSVTQTTMITLFPDLPTGMKLPKWADGSRSFRFGNTLTGFPSCEKKHSTTGDSKRNQSYFSLRSWTCEFCLLRTNYHVSVIVSKYVSYPEG